MILTFENPIGDRSKGKRPALIWTRGAREFNETPNMLKRKG